MVFSFRYAEAVLYVRLDEGTEEDLIKIDKIPIAVNDSIGN